MMPGLAVEEVEAFLAGATGWTCANHRLTRQFRFASFLDAIRFMQAAATTINRLDHHPEWTNCYDRVSVRLTTHDAGDRITEKDLELARLLDRTATGFLLR